MIKRPLYRYRLEASGSRFIFTDDFPPNDAIYPTIFGFTSEDPWIEPSNGIEPDQVQSSTLTFWIVGDDATIAASNINWTPRTGSVTWVNPTQFQTTSIGGKTFVSSTQGAYGNCGVETQYISGSSIHGTGSFHVFYVGRRTVPATLNSGNLWQNHRIVGDVEGWWGLYQYLTGGDTKPYGYLWRNAQLIVTASIAPLDEVFLLEFYRDDSINTIYARVNDQQNFSALDNASWAPATVTMRIFEEPLGEAGELAIFYTQLSEEEQTGVREYFSIKYGISV